MENKKPPIIKFAMQYGLITALVVIIYALILSVLDASNHPIQNMAYLFLFGGIGYGIFRFRNTEMEGFITYSGALSFGSFITLFASFILGIYTYIYLLYVEPTAIGESLKIAQEELMKTELTDEQIESAIKIQAQFATPANWSFSAFFVNLLLGFIFTLIISIFLKKKEDPQPAE